MRTETTDGAGLKKTGSHHHHHHFIKQKIIIIIIIIFIIIIITTSAIVDNVVLSPYLPAILLKYEFCGIVEGCYFDTVEHYHIQWRTLLGGEHLYEIEEYLL